MTQPRQEPPHLDVETYAETVARLQHHPSSSMPRVLEAVGLTEPQWAEGRDRWIRLIEDDMAHGGALVTAFATRFAATRRRLREHGESLPIAPAPPPPDEAADPVDPRVPPAMRGFTSIGGTEVGGNVPTEPVLPFTPATGDASVATSRSTPPPAADPWAGLPPAMRGFASIHDTEIAGAIPARPALPFREGATSADLPPGGLTLERAASLHVEITSLRGGASPSDVLRRYGLSEEQHEELTRYWEGRIVAVASLREQWEAACAAYRAWLLQERPQQPR